MALAPMDATIVTAAGRALRKEGRVGEAVTMLVRASALDPGFAVPWLERGFALDAAGDTRGAAASYARAAALDPGLAPAHAGAAAMALRGGDPDAAVALAHAALTRNPASPVATLTLAAIEARTDPAAAIARLTALLDGPRGDDDRALALTGLGDASDRAGATAAAFAAWTAANTVIARRHAPRFAGHEPQRALIARIAAQVAATPADEWVAPAVAPGPAAGHVFLIGYPRSGTTLVENVLASSPDVVALEERPTFADADDTLTATDGIARLLALDTAALDRLRAAYWARVAAAGADVAGKVFVDMDPLKGLKLPVIARLFPAARIVVMHRDPRDVVLGCFRHSFAISAAAFAFTDLGETANHYAALMTLIELCRARLPLASHVVHYDRLVADFDAETRALCAFAGIAWHDQMRDFASTAARRGVTTASAGQVKRGLFDGGGQWARYAAELAPVLPLLQPWVARFGDTPTLPPCPQPGRTAG